MISDLKPYQEIEYSGSKWYEIVPEHWKARTLWSLSKLRAERNRGDLPLLSIFLNQGVIMHKDDGGQTHAPSLDLSNYQVVHPGDFVLNNQQAWRGSVGVSTYHGIISPAYIVLELSNEFLPGFANYVLRCPVMVDQYVTASKGVGDIQRQIYWPYLREVRVPLPPPIEQAAISSFLDHVDRRISRYISAKQKMIKLLEEQKQAIIHRAVTRGLESSVPLKPSGVEWLGEIPEHWNTVPGRSCFAVNHRSNTGLAENTVLSLSYGRIVVKPEDKLHGLVPASFETYQIIEPGDIVCRPTDLQNDKKSLRFGFSSFRGIITSAYICLQTLEALNKRFGYFLLHTYDLNKIFYGLGSGLRQNLDWQDFKTLPCLFPPIPEQAAIVSFLDEAIPSIDVTKYHAEREIFFLREYRARLISDIVTGNLDVRGIDLPATADAEVPEESNDLLDSDSSAEDEEMQEELLAEDV